MTSGIEPKGDATLIFRLLIIFTVSLTLRIVYLSHASLPTVAELTGDQAGYEQTGRGIAQGALADRQWKFLSEFNPGYPLFIAAVYKLFFGNILALRLANALAGSIAVTLFLLIANRLVSRRSAFIVSLFMAIYPPLVRHCGNILNENLTLLLLIPGLLWTMTAISSRSWKLAAAAGFAMGAVLLCRVTFAATILLFIPVVFFSPRMVTIRERLLMATAWFVPVLIVIMPWVVIAAQHAPPTVGTQGAEIFLQGIGYATDPEYRGWKPIDKSGLNADWVEETNTHNPVYPVTAVGNLIFYHLWFANSKWAPRFFFNAPLAQVIHRLVLLLGICSLGVAVLNWRRWSVILAMVAGIMILAMKFIEVRHNLIYVPAFALLAGLTLDSCPAWCKRIYGWIRGSRTRWLASTLVLSAAMVLIIFGRYFAWTLDSAVSPGVVATGADVVVALLPVGIALLLMVSGDAGARGKTAVVRFLLPALLFSGLWCSYVSVGSEPRWRSRYVPLAGENLAVTQEITLPTAIDPDSVRSAYWVADVRNSRSLSGVRGVLNDAPGDTGRYLLPVRYYARKVNNNSPFITANGVSQAEFDSRATWWVMEADSASLAGRTTVSCTVFADEPQTKTPVELGVSYFNGDGGYYGPSVRSLIDGKRASLYKAALNFDRRLWERCGLESVRSENYFVKNFVAPGDRKPLVHTSHGDVGIRLVVFTKSGGMKVY